MIRTRYNFDDKIMPLKPHDGFFMASNHGITYFVIARSIDAGEAIVYESKSEDIAIQFKCAATQTLNKSEKITFSSNLFDIAQSLRNRNWFKKGLS